MNHVAKLTKVFWSNIVMSNSYMLKISREFINNCTMNQKIDSCSHNITQLTRQKGIKSLWQNSEQLLNCQGSLIVAIPAVHSAFRYLKICWSKRGLCECFVDVEQQYLSRFIWYNYWCSNGIFLSGKIVYIHFNESTHIFF